MTLAAQAGVSVSTLLDALASLWRRPSAAPRASTRALATPLAPAASAAPPAPAPLRTYRVRAGDTAASIAAAHGLSAASLLVRNGLRLRDEVQPGAVLVVERGRGGCRQATSVEPVAVVRHLVAEGEDVDALCARFGVGERVLLAANGFATGACVTPGVTVVVPSSTDPRDTGEVPVVAPARRGVSRSA